MESEANGESDLLARYGVVDEASGRQRAEQAREYLLLVARSVIQEGAFTMDHLIVAGMVARAQSLHEAALTAINSDNPHAAFTLLRAYIEQCAAALYLTDHPDKAERLWNDLDGHGVPIGRITSHADRSGRFGQFRRVYDQLSKYAHPSSISHFAGMRVGEDRQLTFKTAPRFKRDEEKLVAYAWLIEFAHIAHVFMFEFAESRGLGKIIGPDES
jgi:hypothetical protein